MATSTPTKTANPTKNETPHKYQIPASTLDTAVQKQRKQREQTLQPDGITSQQCKATRARKR